MKKLIISGTAEEVCKKIQMLGLKCRMLGLEPTVLNMMEVSNV